LNVYSGEWAMGRIYGSGSNLDRPRCANHAAEHAVGPW